MTGKSIIYNTIIIVFVLAIIVFFLLSELIEHDSYISGGPKFLLCQDNVLDITIGHLFNSLELRFEEPVELDNGSQVYCYDSSNKLIALENDDFIINNVSDQKNIQIKILNDKITGSIRLKIIFKGVWEGLNSSRKYIKSIKLNTNSVGITDFYKNTIDIKKSNITYYKSLSIFNISHFLAKRWGITLVTIIQVSLLVLFFSQFILFFLSLFHSKIIPKSFRDLRESLLSLNVLNYFSRHSITIGFLGTISSIWVSLELLDTIFNNFFQILDLLKVAIFTTVLGLTTRILYEIKEWFYAKES